LFHFLERHTLNSAFLLLTVPSSLPAFPDNARLHVDLRRRFIDLAQIIRNELHIRRAADTQSEYSLCSAVTGRTACGRRIVFLPAPERGFSLSKVYFPFQIKNTVAFQLDPVPTEAAEHFAATR